MSWVSICRVMRGATSSSHGRSWPAHCGQAADACSWTCETVAGGCGAGRCFGCPGWPSMAVKRLCLLRRHRRGARENAGSKGKGRWPFSARSDGAGDHCGCARCSRKLAAGWRPDSTHRHSGRHRQRSPGTRGRGHACPASRIGCAARCRRAASWPGAPPAPGAGRERGCCWPIGTACAGAPRHPN